MAFKLFLFSLIMIFSLVFLTKKILKNTKFLGMEKLLNQASEDQKIQFAKSFFELYDANKDGFVTRDEFDNKNSETLPNNLRFASLTNVGMSIALKKFDLEGGKSRQIGIDLEDFKRSMKKKLSEVSNASKMNRLNNF